MICNFQAAEGLGVGCEVGSKSELSIALKHQRSLGRFFGLNLDLIYRKTNKAGKQCVAFK